MVLSLLEIKNLSMYYNLSDSQVKAVDDVSFKMNHNENLGIVGESGCGKSSIALTILKLLPSNGRIIKGQILFGGFDLTKLSEKEMNNIRWKKISYIFQSAMNALNPVLKVGNFLIEVQQEHEDISKKEARERAIELFNLVGLESGVMNKYPHELSGGMRQRVIIATSLLFNPDLIIADEPTTALDVVVQDEILEKIKELQKKFHSSMILITHNIAMVAELCNKVAVMYGGKIMEFTDTISIFTNSHNPYTLALINTIPSIRGPKRRLMSIPGSPPNLLYPPYGCIFHPRCPIANKICKEEIPPWIEVAENHYSRCHLALDKSLKEIKIEYY